MAETMNWPPEFCVFLSKVEVIPQKQETDYISQNPSDRDGNVTRSCASTWQPKAKVEKKWVVLPPSLADSYSQRIYRVAKPHHGGNPGHRIDMQKKVH